MSGEAKSRHPAKLPLDWATGFLDFARNDGYVKKFPRAIVDLA
jgi:hypothetical protein